MPSFPKSTASVPRIAPFRMENAGFDGDMCVLRHNGGFDKIEILDVGCLVMSRCERTGEIAPKRILKIHERSAKQYGIVCNYGPGVAAIRGRSSGFIFATEEQPFWIEGKGWTPVRELQPGDAFLTHDGDSTTVKCLRTPEELGLRSPIPVYNLELEDSNTYFVGVAGVWVHNCSSETKAPGS